MGERVRLHVDEAAGDELADVVPGERRRRVLVPVEGGVTVDDPARHEDRRRDVELGQHGRGREQVVAVAVVEGHAHVAARARASAAARSRDRAGSAPRRSRRPRASARGSARARPTSESTARGDPVVAEDAHARPGGRAHPGPRDPRALVGARCQIGGAQRRDALPGHLVVEPLDAVDHDLGRIAALDELTAAACAPRAFGRIEQGLDDGGGQGARLLGRDEPARLARPDDVGRAADGGGHDRALECERLECESGSPSRREGSTTRSAAAR